MFKLPETVPFEAGAGLLFNDLTMHHALRTRGRLAEGETVLVHGAAGGIGTATLRLAPVWGASRTIAVVGTEDKIAIAKSAGASDVVLADALRKVMKSRDLAERMGEQAYARGAQFTWPDTVKAYSGDDGPADQARFGGIYCVALDLNGTKLVATDLDNRRIRVIDLKSGTVQLVAGNGKKGVPADGDVAKTSPLADPRAVRRRGV